MQFLSFVAVALVVATSVSAATISPRQVVVADSIQQRAMHEWRHGGDEIVSVGTRTTKAQDMEDVKSIDQRTRGAGPGYHDIVSASERAIKPQGIDDIESINDDQIESANERTA